MLAGLTMLLLCVRVCIYDNAVSYGDSGTDKASVRYWIDDSSEYPQYYRQDGEYKGIYARIISRLTEELGGTLAKVDAESADDALDMLEAGEVELVFGLPSVLADEDTGDFIDRTAVVYRNVLTAVVMPESIDYSDAADNKYWGVESIYLPLIFGEELEECLLDFNSSAALYRALVNKEVYGIIVKRSSIDAGILLEGSFDYAEYGELYAECDECILLNSNNNELNEKIKAVVSEFCGETDAEDRYDRLTEYANLLTKTQDSLKRTKLAIILGAVFCTGLLGVIIVLLMRLKKQSFTAYKKSGELSDGEGRREHMELKLRGRKLTAYGNFAVFGFPADEIKNPITLKELTERTGFDFCSHYEHILAEEKGQYSSRFVLYSGGKKLYIFEEGKIERGKIEIIFENTEL